MGESSGPLSNPFLGGATLGLRGYTETSVYGSDLAIFSAEYEFPIYYDLDQDLFGLSLLHTIEGKFFLDTGNASEEHNLFLFNQYLADFGMGLRQELDLFGAYPTGIEFQIGYPISSPIPGERAIHYYLNFGVHL
jgi:hemolysin activation/secretion protein